MSYANDMPSVEQIARTDTGLASALRISVARLSRRLRSQRDPQNELSVGQLSEKGSKTLAKDRQRRDAWLALRLRELTPEERAVLRQAAPILERLAHA